MRDEGTDLIGNIDKALQRTTDLFLQQCSHGAQTRALPAQFAACGQFIGDEAAIIEQFGLHGISAALRVLAPCSSEQCRLIVGRLVDYSSVCFGVLPLPTSDLRRIDNLDNVIKLGELLYGLSFVSPSQGDTTHLIRYIANRLQASLRNDKGWGYFLDDSIPELLPTAYAIRGLAQAGFDVSGPHKFILEMLHSRVKSSHESAADLTTAVACAYCLTFVRGSSSQDSIVVETFDLAWRSLEPLLGEDIEQNLEYWRGTETHYVRVPWQIYLLALAAEYSFWRFSTFRAQRRLGALINSLQYASFRYPYSGRYLSSRTNAMAFDALTAIRERVRRRVTLRIANGIDHLRIVAGSRPTRLIAAAVALGIIIDSITEWVATGGKVSDLGPKFIASLITLVLASARR